MSVPSSAGNPAAEVHDAEIHDAAIHGAGMHELESRPRTSRRASRIVVVHDGRVLLFRDTDPGVPGSFWLMTPGGGLDEGETWLDAAVRELHEETGWRLPASAFVGPVAHRTVVHGYSDRITEQEEMFFRVEVDAALVERGLDTTGHTANERQRITGHGWYSPAELAQVPVWPTQLAQLVDADPSAPQARGVRELGDVEESTVPVPRRPVSGSAAAPDGCSPASRS